MLSPLSIRKAFLRQRTISPLLSPDVAAVKQNRGEKKKEIILPAWQMLGAYANSEKYGKTKFSTIFLYALQKNVSGSFHTAVTSFHLLVFYGHFILARPKAQSITSSNATKPFLRPVGVSLNLPLQKAWTPSNTVFRVGYLWAIINTNSKNGLKNQPLYMLNKTSWAFL